MLLFDFVCQSQVIVKFPVKKKMIIGFHTEFLSVNYKDTLTSKSYYLSDFYIEPYVGLFFNKNIGIGIIGGYESIRSNIAKVDNQKNYEIGCFSRFYYPFRFNSKKISIINNLST